MRVTEPMQRLKAEFFKTLAHPARIQVLEILAKGECSVTELSERVGIEGSHMSQQLGVLRRAALVEPRKDGSTVYYSLTDAHIADILRLSRQVLVTYMRDAAEQLAGWDD